MLSRVRSTHFGGNRLPGGTHGGSDNAVPDEAEPSRTRARRDRALFRQMRSRFARLRRLHLKPREFERRAVQCAATLRGRHGL